MTAKAIRSILVAGAIFLFLVIISSCGQEKAYDSNPTSSTDKALSKLPLGHAALYAPSTVKQYQGFDVFLQLSKSDLEKLIKKIRAESSHEIAIQGVSRVHMSPRMKAEIIAQNFLIEGDKIQEQAVTLNEDTQWVWRVHSETVGRQTIKARLHTLINLDGKETPRTIDIAEAEISVEVSPLKWAQQNWEFIATAILIPFIGWAFKRFFERKKSD